MKYCATCGGITHESCPPIVEYTGPVPPRICACMTAARVAAYAELRHIIHCQVAKYARDGALRSELQGATTVILDAVEAANAGRLDFGSPEANGAFKAGRRGRPDSTPGVTVESPVKSEST